MRFVDTSVFIRYITGDNPEMQAASAELFAQAARGEVLLKTSETVIGEIVFVLSSARTYNLGRETVGRAINAIISMDWLMIPDRQKYIRAADIYSKQNIDFSDALIVATMEQEEMTVLYSYDRHFDRLKSVTRLEPPAPVDEQ